MVNIASCMKQIPCVQNPQQACVSLLARKAHLSIAAFSVLRQCLC
eukprot:jgi/Antlo1/1231/1947